MECGAEWTAKNMDKKMGSGDWENLRIYCLLRRTLSMAWIKEQSLTGCAEPLRYLWGYENYGRVTIQMYCFIRGIIRILAGIGTLGVIASVSKKVQNGSDRIACCRAKF